jgi:phosphoribosylformylglycinamidine cyclo-ligase
MPETALSYRDAGVDIDEAQRALSSVLPEIHATHNENVIGGIGGFGGLFKATFPEERPILVSSIDGVGTKTKVAAMVGDYRGLGKDIVNHCVNDILCQGARPLYFMDYYGTSRLSSAVFGQVLHSMAEACSEVGCALLGGETAEMPGVYHGDDYDLAGFAVGAAERGAILPRDDMRAGDVMLGLASSGVHSNGFSLVRKVAAQSKLKWSAAAPFEKKRKLGAALLAPTRVYVKSCLAAIRETKAVKALAHITGGGFPDNIPRVLPKNLAARVDLERVPVLPVFRWLAQAGRIAESEMLRTFNCGIGMIVVVESRAADKVVAVLKREGETVVRLGELVPAAKGKPRVRYTGRLNI